MDPSVADETPPEVAAFVVLAVDDAASFLGRALTSEIRVKRRKNNKSRLKIMMKRNQTPCVEMNKNGREVLSRLLNCDRLDA